MSQHPFLQAVLLTLVAGFTLSGMDAIGKVMMAEYHPTQVVWARYFFHTLLVGGVYAAQDGWAFMLPLRPGLQIARGGLLLLVTLGMYFAIRTVSLADATAIMFIAPVLVTGMAGLFLGEQLRPVHHVAVAVGFVGVLFIIRPGFTSLDQALLLPCLSAFSLAGYFVLTRYLRDKDAPHTTLFHTTATGSIAMTVLVVFWWQPPDAYGWLILVAIGGLGAAGHFMLIRAFNLVPAASLAPFLNAQLLGAASYSIWWFGEDPTWMFWLGSALIAGAGVLVSRSDSSLARSGGQ